MTAPLRRGANVATQPRPISTRPIVLPIPEPVSVPPPWTDGPPPLIAIALLIAAGLAVMVLAWLVR